MKGKITSRHFNTEIDVKSLYERLISGRGLSPEQIESIGTELSKNFILKDAPIVEIDGSLKHTSNIYYNRLTRTYIANESGYAYQVKDQIILLPMIYINASETRAYIVIPSSKALSKPLPLYRLIGKELYTLTFKVTDLEEKLKQIKQLFATTGGAVLLGEAKDPHPSFNGLLTLAEEKFPVHEPLAYKFLSYEAMSLVEPIEEDEYIGSYQVATEAQDGVDLNGKIIPAPIEHNSQEEFLGYGEGIRIDIKTEQAYASTNGYLKIGQNNIPYVSPTLIINSDARDYISSEEDIVISGSILRGTLVYAKKNLIVFGNVEGARIYAQGEITIQGGITNKSYLQSYKGVEAQFITSSEILVKGCVRIRKYILNSVINGTGTLRLYDPEKGVITDSNISMGGTVSAAIGGSKQGRTTNIEILRLPERHFMKCQIEKVDDEMASIDKQLDKFRRLYGDIDVVKSEEVGISNERTTYLEKMEKQIVELRECKENLEKFKKELYHNRLNPIATQQSATQQFLQPVVHISRTLYQGVNISIHNRRVVVNHELAGAEFLLDAGHKKLIRKSLS